MNQLISEFTKNIEKEFRTGKATEHTYRPAVKSLIESINNKVTAINEPKRQKVGAPDFVFQKNKIPVGYAEMKDIDEDLDLFFQTGANNKQFERYMELGNIFISNHLDFIFYKNGKEYQRLSIGKLENKKIVFDESQFLSLEHLLSNFLKEQSQTITSAKDLAKMMADKAKLLKDVVSDILINEEEIGDIHSLYHAFKDTLLHDITPQVFADVYAQTLAYGLFVARCHDKTKEDFSRYEALSLIPGSNPFLQKLFQHVSGPDLDTRASWVVDELATVFLYTDIETILQKFGSETKQEDPVVHFYETFLGEYDKKLKKSRGVYYTPLPVVQFIVRAVDSVLRKEFDLSDGLADIEKLSSGIHKVQILDPAVGTGTFLNETIKHIYKNFENKKNIWPSYVKNDLISRLHGFELLMAPYTICHFKLGLTLKETGYTEENKRLSVWLTNSLEEGAKELPNVPMGGFLTAEAKNANKIKNETPIMVVIGNPPYSISSSNRGEWVLNLIKDYKKDLEINGKKEKKLNLDDDYIKFIRLAEFLIEKNGEGIVAMITNNSYIDGITHRQMRKHLLETFDSIYIYDLHGNSNIGEKDGNVFDIQQGVAISIFIKKKDSKKKLADVYHTESFGLREEKYQKLNEGEFEKIKWNKLNYSEPYYFFEPKDFGEQKEYNKGLSVEDIFISRGAGVKTERDKISIHFDQDSLKNTVNDFVNLSISEIRSKYELPKDSRDWSIERAKQDVIKNYNFEKYLLPINYRPFDQRWIYYTGISKGFVGTPGAKIMRNIIKNNIGLVLARQFGGGKHFICFIANQLFEISSQPYAPYTLFPLYLYKEDNSKILNLKKDVVEKIEEMTGKTKPEDILDYVYAVLYSPNYREKYKESLKIDFPRVPFPKDKDVFWKLVEKGKELRELHLMESLFFENSEIEFKGDGKNVVEKVKFEEIKNGIGRVMISSFQYFENVPKTAWEFYIGGYQPAQKWLKDRKGRELFYEDIEHYKKIIKVLIETNRIMKEIDEIKF